MSSSQPLYGVPRPNAGLKPAKEMPVSSTSLAFTSQLSSLLAQSSSSHPSTTATARSRPSKTSKEDIFKTHNKNTKKRALADVSSSSDGRTQYRDNDGSALDSGDLHRSKRKMEEKARLYAAMKRGDYVPPTGRGGNSSSSRNLEEHSLVDFDRKWADSLERKKGPSSSNNNHDNDKDTSSGEDNDNDEDEDEDDDNTQLPYEDEFGRLRHGTRKEIARHLQRRAAASHADSELQSFTARPLAPSTILHGDVIQSASFNPDTTIAAQMDALARKRDRSLTPPAESHYDASKEIRSKGVGFYQFSKEEGERAREMGELEGRRGETERVKREQEERRERRRREVEERKRVISRKREERLADRFLAELG
ncbi:MAG: hypothetical protein L6R36_007450 [Xanthoria steineri]|nr:MAG: hypothetical protein L6R36_007450 [Xanthoria steineri]